MKVTLELPDWVDDISVTMMGFASAAIALRVNIKDGDVLKIPSEEAVKMYE